MCQGHDHDHEHHHHHHHEESCSSSGKGVKIAITGKGGVGKTTLAALLARSFADHGGRVLAVDADPDANLATALGISAAALTEVQPISRMKDLAKERTGAQEGYGSFFKLNPQVNDLPDTFSVEHDGVRLLQMGTVEQGGTGCVCPEHTLVKRLMKHLLLERDDVVIMDMEAGIEHLGRGTAESVDGVIVVVEPGQRSVQTAQQITRLASDIGIRKVFVVGSKVQNEKDREFIEAALPEHELLGFISYSDEIKRADMGEGSVSGQSAREACAIRERLMAQVVAG
ncbi:AAA family ATPase [Geomonas sp. RF6]|uniref:ATP-binding protein n=1 Tax=Geomonas sp. RF6 TaxID=2897342 RepID=UPI001E4EFCA0|nr:carbon monoxide dehydrogenase accessory protein CooC [Geomonas sp. RF6]UFS68554.1 AAA family ATPase [Geomonas sp. RF6]